MDHRNEVIGRLAPGKSFVDIGGLWGLENEKVTVAHKAGATGLCMVDIWKPDSEWWLKFRKLRTDLGVPPVREVTGSIDSLATVSEVGQYDIVHCSGVIYHCPNPFHTLQCLRSIASETLILASAVMPPVIENDYGKLELSHQAAVCVPCLDGTSRVIFSKYIQERFGGGAWGITDRIDCWYFSDGAPNYGPWWWLWTTTYLQRLVLASGLEILEDYDQFDGTGRLFVCKRVALSEF